METKKMVEVLQDYLSAMDGEVFDLEDLCTDNPTLDAEALSHFIEAELGVNPNEPGSGMYDRLQLFHSMSKANVSDQHPVELTVSSTKSRSVQVILNLAGIEFVRFNCTGCKATIWKLRKEPMVCGLCGGQTGNLTPSQEISWDQRTAEWLEESY